MNLDKLIMLNKKARYGTIECFVLNLMMEQLIGRSLYEAYVYHTKLLLQNDGIDYKDSIGAVITIRNTRNLFIAYRLLTEA